MTIETQVIEILDSTDEYVTLQSISQSIGVSPYLANNTLEQLSLSDDFTIKKDYYCPKFHRANRYKHSHSADCPTCNRTYPKGKITVITSARIEREW